MTTKSCEICSEKEHKYKCPTCLMKYCSLGCYKSHKNDGCEKKTPDSDYSSRSSSGSGNWKAQCNIQHKSQDPEEDEDQVGEEKLDLLRSDAAVVECLKNPHLRELLKHIDEKETGAGMLIEAAMQDLAFSEFATACLNCVEPGAES